MTIDLSTRCPQHYIRSGAVTPEQAAELECRDYHEHHARFVVVTDQDRHLAAEREWSDELRRIAALPLPMREKVVREQCIHHVDRKRIQEMAAHMRRKVYRLI